MSRHAPQPLLLMGQITRARGLRGEVFVRPYNPDSPLWRKGTTLYALSPDALDGDADIVHAKPQHTFVLKACRPQELKNRSLAYLCLFEGIQDRNTAETLKDLELAIPLPDPGEAEDDLYYHFELRGFTARDPLGETLGVVHRVLPAPAHDLLEIQGPDLEIRGLVPFVAAIVTDIDREGRVLTIDAPEGLLE